MAMNAFENSSRQKQHVMEVKELLSMGMREETIKI
jgi:hypothetical protein